MPLREDILEPIPGENPSGTDQRYSPSYDKIKEARREDDDLPQGAWVQERKVADHRKVIELSQELLAKTSKDLQLAVWLTQSLTSSQGFVGLRDGLTLFHGLFEKFWDTLHPELEDGDAEPRADLLGAMAKSLESVVRKVPLCNEGYAFYQYQESRLITTEDAAKTKEEKAAREAKLKEGKTPPEAIDKAFGETPKAYYAAAEKSIDASVEALTKLDAISREKFGMVAPSFNKLRSQIDDIRGVIHKTLEKKRETDPDPVEEVPPEPEVQAAEGAEVSQAGTIGGDSSQVSVRPMALGQDPGDRGVAIANVAAAAAFLRQKEPFSPAPYLMLRGLRWGELRASQDPAVLEAPPTEVRRQIKAQAMNNKWKELLATAENVMASPYGRAWLDLQRFVVEACVALGSDYEAIAISIRSELRALLRDLPQLLEVTLSDDTPAANADTQAWLKELMAEPVEAAPGPNVPRLPVKQNPKEPGWQKKFIDPQSLASEAMRQGKPQRAFELLHSEFERQRSGRGRFQRKMQLAQMAIAAGKDTIAQPLLDDILATMDTHKLEEWEDPETVASALAFLIQSSKKVQGDAKLKQAMFERICRLDPVQALSV
jgi:type VI secretion system protein ImpA